jgi:HAD-superfamily hydrolase, subfamily IIB
LSTLYVTDLDGTLLNNEATIEREDLQTLNTLIKNGTLFSVATGRSYTTAKKILEPIHLTLPALFLNGVHVFDMQRGRTLYTKNMGSLSVEKILAVFRKVDICSIFYVMMPNGNVTLYYDNAKTEMAKRFIASRANFLQEVSDYEAILEKPLEEVISKHQICFIIALEKDEKKIAFIMHALSFIDGISYHLYEERTHGFLSIEVFSKEGGKDKGISFLKEYTRAENVISFGDNLNDISMKEQSNLFCVVENALPEMKAYADYIIPSNNESGVISFIHNNTHI